MMQEIPKIENFNTFIQSNLGNDKKILSYKCKYLTKPGDNYGSTMLGVTCYIQNKLYNNNIEELELVAKLPPTNQEFWDIFQPERTFITESKCYTILAPALKQIQREAGLKNDEIIDIFPKCYGVRLNLNENNNCNNYNNEMVDKNATLILENLSASGYKCGDRFKGFDYKHTLIILRDLAYFHALPIALRKLKPKMFEKQIKPFIAKFNMSANIKPELKEKLDKANKISLKKANISEHDYNNILKLMKLDDERDKNVQQCPDGPFTTLVHSDFWVNNMLILYDDHGKPDKIKIIDFQIAQYDSLVNDLIFFLFTSVDSKTLEANCKTFLQHYFNKFIECLEKIKCDISEYSFQSFLIEINQLAYLEVPHILMMLRVLYIRKDALPNYDDIDPNKFSSDENISNEYYQKVSDVVDLLKKYKWFEIREK